ncbi:MULTISPECIES: CDP-diacylglycerol--serine O-phosphatidyltransferase [Desulfovibrio]|uniref:CDP-diacylglycerol--serine O-phosphatidyltransferase n=3 Tax=Desulfovibrio TaxID=872 RepID=A0AA94HUC7_DESDE|nr:MULTISPECIES: CDP-diacylglycerol--serine O-phosphatidyltransferase [Desulfovibrio]ATD81997.1 CDP-diacylglycerol--serine O-phosphatidyltransferase [Desulfovibrio sp. G11]MDY0204065.1 CDP-diacylglycerol--serine O-phosphatidyltransferase [Desulfovibrio desulfuricans]SFW65340.1 CDP-diacylglycerol---serine O-phosphatidyltransferase [Desulfovibrio desulfuricans]SPD34747.1 CDP-diacylglycerol-serine O-phosphatidyltransferase [Desulfovibrio sp. G11]
MTTEVKKPRKGVYLLPNMITTLSMFLGFLSMVWAGQGRFEAACMAILLSAVMDGLDGKVARLTNTASEFGVQYDSLSDLVAFGLAPAMLLWQWQLQSFNRVGIAAAFIYAACGALRLARFNVSTAAAGKRFFIGLPIPAGGCTIVTFVFFAALFPEVLQPVTPYVALLLALGVGTLMVSRVRYFSFKEYDFLRAHPVRTMLAFLLVLATVISFPRVMGFMLCAVYIAGGLVYTFVILPRRDRQLLRALSPQSD